MVIVREHDQATMEQNTKSHNIFVAAHKKILYRNILDGGKFQLGI